MTTLLFVIDLNMHGRNVFDGRRKHGGRWFEGWEGEEEMKKKAAAATR